MGFGITAAFFVRAYVAVTMSPTLNSERSSVTARTPRTTWKFRESVRRFPFPSSTVA